MISHNKFDLNTRECYEVTISQSEGLLKKKTMNKVHRFRYCLLAFLQMAVWLNQSRCSSRFWHDKALRRVCVDDSHRRYAVGFRSRSFVLLLILAVDQVSRGFDKRQKLNGEQLIRQWRGGEISSGKGNWWRVCAVISTLCRKKTAKTKRFNVVNRDSIEKKAHGDIFIAFHTERV